MLRFDKAMSESGFCVLTSHGVKTETVQNLLSASRNFFTKFSIDEKMKYNHGTYGNSEGGYTRVGQEKVAQSMTPGTTTPFDIVENYVMRGDLLRSPSRLKNNTKHYSTLLEAGRSYYLEMVQLMELVHRVSAKALGKSSDFFEGFYTPPDVSLRLAHYPPLSSIPSLLPGQLRYGAHTDYTGFTFLYVDNDNIEGLQIYNDDKWVDVVGIPEGSLVVNIGDLMSLWTGGRWKATLHRVVNPASSSPAYNNHRFSIPFFTGPSLDSVITPLDQTTQGSSTHPKIVAGEWLKQKIERSNM